MNEESKEACHIFEGRQRILCWDNVVYFQLGKDKYQLGFADSFDNQWISADLVQVILTLPCDSLINPYPELESARSSIQETLYSQLEWLILPKHHFNYIHRMSFWFLQLVDAVI
jgi:hypothetical protein